MCADKNINWYTLSGYEAKHDRAEKGTTKWKCWNSFWCSVSLAPTWWGFQSLSKMTTVSAACRFRPSPPALVLRRKMKYWDPSSLNFFSSDALSSDLVVPETSNHNTFRAHDYSPAYWSATLASLLMQDISTVLDDTVIKQDSSAPVKVTPFKRE